MKDVNEQFNRLFAADENISPAMRESVDHYTRALGAVNNSRLNDIRECLKDARPAMLKLIELYGAECWVAGRQSFAEDLK